MNLAHARAALAAVFAAVLFLAAGDWHATNLIRTYAAALAPLNLPEALRGVALQRQILRHPELLPIYGSSELAKQEPTEPSRFFRTHRTGFGVAPVGAAGDHCLIIVQELVPLADLLHGKQIVIFLSPSWFTPRSHWKEDPDHLRFAARYSPLEAGTMAFGNTLDRNLKRDIAVRLLHFEGVLQERSPLVATACAALQDVSWTSRSRFAILSPLGALHNLVLQLQDQWQCVDLIDEHPALMPIDMRHQPTLKPVKWAELFDEFEQTADARNSGGINNLDSKLFDESSDTFDHREHLRDLDTDAAFLQRMNASDEWVDFILLLRVLREIGAHALLIDQPINGCYSDNCGVSAAARQVYYNRVKQLSASYHVPVQDFSSHEEDPDFFSDVVHPSAKAWIYYNRTLDQFYHHPTG